MCFQTYGNTSINIKLIFKHINTSYLVSIWKSSEKNVNSLQEFIPAPIVQIHKQASGVKVIYH